MFGLTKKDSLESQVENTKRILDQLTDLERRDKSLTSKETRHALAKEILLRLVTHPEFVAKGSYETLANDAVQITDAFFKELTK